MNFWVCLNEGVSGFGQVSVGIEGRRHLPMTFMAATGTPWKVKEHCANSYAMSL